MLRPYNAHENYFPFLRKRDQLISHFRADTSLRFLGGCADVRGADDVIQLEQFPICGRFFGEDIQCRACDCAVGQGFIQSILINDTAARAVDDPHAFLHLGKLLRADHIRGLFGLRQMQADVVGLCQQFIECDQLDASNFLHVGIIRNNGHAHHGGAFGNFLADVAHADQTEGFAADLVAVESSSCPIFQL